jgi:hypothetical protein
MNKESQNAPDIDLDALEHDLTISCCSLANHAARELIRRLREADKDAERYRWVANRVLASDYGDNETNGEQIGWRICHDLLAKNGRQPAFMFGDSINAAIDSAMSKESDNG